MTNQQILDNAPDGATHIVGNDVYMKLEIASWYVWAYEKWQSIGLKLHAYRSIADIKEIVELREKLARFDI